MTEYVICVNTKNYGYCLETVGGYNIKRAINKMREIEKKNPNKQFKIIATNPAENWWNNGTH